MIGIVYSLSLVIKDKSLRELVTGKFLATMANDKVIK